MIELLNALREEKELELSELNIRLGDISNEVYTTQQTLNTLSNHRSEIDRDIENVRISISNIDITLSTVKGVIPLEEG